MTFRTLAAAAALVVSTTVAHAQGAGLYLNPIASRISNSTADTGPFAFLGQGSTSQWFTGVNLGALYDLPVTPRVNVGLDVHEALQHGNNASLRSFLVGVRVVGKFSNSAFKPYLEPQVGLGTSKAPTAVLRVSKLQYSVAAGVDYPLGKHVDLRVVELGYGAVTTSSSQTIGGTATIPQSRILTLTSGLVFRIP